MKARRMHSLIKEVKQFPTEVFESIQDAYIVADLNGKIKYMNKPAINMFGYTQIPTNKSLTCLMPKRYMENHNRALDNLRQHKDLRLRNSRIVVWAKKIDGEEFEVEIAVGRLNENHICAILRKTIPNTGIGIRWIIWYASILHIIWGISLLLFSGEILHTTAIDGILRVFGNSVHAGLMLLLIGALSAYTCIRGSDKTGISDLLKLIPQQWLLFVSAMSSFTAMANSAFADGVERARVFIICDQVPIILTAILHLMVLLQIYAPITGHIIRSKKAKHVRA